MSPTAFLSPTDFRECNCPIKYVSTTRTTNYVDITLDELTVCACENSLDEMMIISYFRWVYTLLYQFHIPCGQVERALDSRSKGLRLNFKCWSCAEVSGKLHIHTSLVYSAAMGTWCRFMCGSIVAGCIGVHLARGRVSLKNMRGHGCLDCKQIALPLHLKSKNHSMFPCTPVSKDCTQTSA